jgi:hypothetical protein
MSIEYRRAAGRLAAWRGVTLNQMLDDKIALCQLTAEPTSMQRTLVSPDELRDLLNAELRKYEECAACQFRGIMRLQGTDETGCNWSEPMLRSSGQPYQVCLPTAQKVIAAAREKYNLK